MADFVEQLRAKLVEIATAEQTCLTDVVVSLSQGGELPQVQAVMARCRQTAASAAATAIDTFCNTCSELATHTTPSTEAAIVTATAQSVTGFWSRSESLAAAFSSEAAAMLPTQGPDKAIQSIKASCGQRVSSINVYFEQLTS